MRSINPYTQEEIARYAHFSKAETEKCLARAGECFGRYRQSTFAERSRLLRNLAIGLKEQREELARCMTAEMGKPIVEARAEVDKCAWVCRYYASEGQKMLEPHRLDSDGEASWAAYRPLGAVLAIMPWNFPLWQVFRFAAPTLMAGNVALLKHAENVQGCAEAIEALIHRAGWPQGAFQNLRIPVERVEEVIADWRVKAVSLTGSVEAGSAVAAAAGKAIKPSLLELGGSCGFLVLQDADINQAARLAARARLMNTGQSCIAAKRFIVVQEVYERFETALSREMKAYPVSDPTSETARLGPLARLDLAEKLERQMQESRQKGARLLLGGEREKAQYPPAILGDVQPGMPAFDEELFGPVAALVRARDEDHALELNNRSAYGLGVSIFTQRHQKAEEWAEQLEDGAVFINEWVKSDPRAPFGGTKNSGYGRELGFPGIRAFTNLQTLHVKHQTPRS